MGAAVTHFEINARDTKRLQDFYGTLFDWKIDTSNPLNYGMVDTGLAIGIGGGIGQAGDQAPACATFYVQVEDVQAYLDRAIRLGGKVVVPFTEIPDMVTMAKFADPEGNLIGLVKGPQSVPKPAGKPRARRKSARKPARKTLRGGAGKTRRRRRTH
jgi:predicted enzyme related to lactoylglutathione lyase